MTEVAAVGAARARVRVDMVTLVALAVLVYTLGDVLHELVGHGGVCALVGGKALAFDTVHMECDRISGWNARWVEAAGTAANLITGIAFLIWHHARRGNSLFDYFLWLFGVHGLFIGGGYMLSSPFGHFGDWNVFIAGLPAPLAWRIGITAVGVVIYRWTMKIGARELVRYLPGDPAERVARAKALTWIPYFTGGLLLLVGGLLNRVGWQLIFVSAIAAGFFGPIGFFFMHHDVPRTDSGPGEGAAQAWPRWPARRGMVAVGAVVAIGFAVIARGVAL